MAEGLLIDLGILRLFMGQHFWKDHIGLCSTVCVQIDFLFKLLEQTMAKLPVKLLLIRPLKCVATWVFLI